jgi:ATP-dependent DNA helicase RecQ
VETVQALGENNRIPALVDFIMGKETKEVMDYNLNKSPYFGCGRNRDKAFWQSVIRQAVLRQYLVKDIEQYGVIKVGSAAPELLKDRPSVEIAINRDFEQELMDDGPRSIRSGALDDQLLNHLKDLRRSLAKQHNLPPFVIFQDVSLEDMATQYPVNMEDMTRVSGVSKGKAERYGQPFLDVIRQHVEENDIDRPSDMVVKQVANKSKSKIAIINGIDRKVPLEDIARSSNLKMEDLLQEMEMIVLSGTKLNIDYYIEENVDEYTKEDIYDYFMNAESDSVDMAFQELSEDDVTLEEIQLVRIKFMSDMAN